MEIALILIAVVASLLLILAVIIQPGKSDMISGMAGLGGQMTNLLGVRQSRNVLQSATMILLGVIALIAFATNTFIIETAASKQEEAQQQEQAAQPQGNGGGAQKSATGQRAPAQQGQPAPAGK